MVKRGKNKRGDMEIEQIGKIALAILFLVLAIFIIIFLLKGGGGKILDSIRNLLRFGR